MTINDRRAMYQKIYDAKKAGASTEILAETYEVNGTTVRRIVKRGDRGDDLVGYGSQYDAGACTCKNTTYKRRIPWPRIPGVRNTGRVLVRSV